MAPALTSRDELISRILPQMVLSEGSNPLTRPLSPPPPNLTPAERAAWRFTIRGNAIGKQLRHPMFHQGMKGQTLMD